MELKGKESCLAVTCEAQPVHRAGVHFEDLGLNLFNRPEPIPSSFGQLHRQGQQLLQKPTVAVVWDATTV